MQTLLIVRAVCGVPALSSNLGTGNKTQAANENRVTALGEGAPCKHRWPSGCLNWFVCCVETMSMCPQKISKLIKCHELN